MDCAASAVCEAEISVVLRVEPEGLQKVNQWPGRRVESLVLSKCDIWKVVL